MKHLGYILPTILAVMLTGCAADDAPAPVVVPDGADLYIEVDLATGEISRVAHDYNGSAWDDSSTDISAHWELGDFIKVYETDTYANDDPVPAYTDVYHDYADYAAQNPFPRVPEVDRYYRFECIGGQGTSHGVFKYKGLATSKIVRDAETGAYNVALDIKANHKIRNWDRFQGVAIYDYPLRGAALYTQSGNCSLSHLKYGQRMYGNMCFHNYKWWFDDHTQTSSGVGAEGLVMHNAGTCIYQVLIGGLDIPVYGGSKITLSLPLTTAVTLPEYSRPLSLTIGNASDFAFGNDPLCKADPEQAHPHSTEYNLMGFIMGWPGTLPAGTTVQVKLHEQASGKTYVWNVTAQRDILFAEGHYYTIDLRDDEWTVEQ